MLFRKKNEQVEQIEELVEEVKRYKDLYRQNQILLNDMIKETLQTVDNKTKRGA